MIQAMIQVLHLMSTDADFQALRTAEAIRRAAGADMTITTRRVGRGGNYRNAAIAGMALRFGRGELLDVVHAWDLPSMLGAAGGPTPLIFSPSSPLPGVLTWLRAAMVYRNATVIATSAAMKRSLVRQGIPGSRCDIIAPPIDASMGSLARDETLRLELGLAPDDRVVLAPGESVRCEGHGMAIHVVSILHVLDPRYRILLWGRGEGVGAAKRLARKLGHNRLVVSAEDVLGRHIGFEELTRVADVALATAPSACATLPIAACMAAGMPIVAGATPALTEFLRDGISALLAPKLAPRLLAERILQLQEDPQRAAALGRNARVEAARRFDLRACTGSYFSLYRHAAGVAPKGVLAPRSWEGQREAVVQGIRPVHASDFR
jgi:glycosyltransferase involved in cell wall biosynthesis